jgi:putative tryptophan/tyrosine transport system substrate-binding protein
MKRREFIAGLGGAAAWSTAVQAQQRVPPTVGWIHTQKPEAHRPYMPAFYEGLAEMGYVEGRNVFSEHRWAEGQYDRQLTLATDLVRRQVAVIVTDTTTFAQIAKAATQTIPIVISSAGGDLVEFGLAASLNHPGGNVTGVSLLGIKVTGKRLELLCNLVPAARSIAAWVGDPNLQFTRLETRDLQSAAGDLGVSVSIINVSTESDVTAAFATLIAQQADALLISANVVFQQRRDQIISLAARHRIPSMFFDSASAAAGAFSSYGPDLFGAYHQAGLYVGRILNGEKPADLPIVQPTKFELVINLKTAKTLGLEIPPTFLALADEVIE